MAMSQTVHVPLQRPNRVVGKAVDTAGTLDQMVSFLLETLFSSDLLKLEQRLAHALFHESAHVVLIPRQRPTLSRALKIDDLMASDRDALKCRSTWVETERMQEPCVWHSCDGGDHRALRITSTVILDPDPTSADARNIDILFVIGVVDGVERVRACTLVFDESSNTSSPITMV